LIPESLAKTSNVEDGEVDAATKPLRIGGQVAVYLVLPLPSGNLM